MTLPLIPPRTAVFALSPGLTVSFGQTDPLCTCPRVYLWHHLPLLLSYSDGSLWATQEAKSSFKWRTCVVFPVLLQISGSNRYLIPLAIFFGREFFLVQRRLLIRRMKTKKILSDFALSSVNITPSAPSIMPTPALFFFSL